jgi:hypothetical protein
MTDLRLCADDNRLAADVVCWRRELAHDGPFADRRTTMLNRSPARGRRGTALRGCRRLC